MMKVQSAKVKKVEKKNLERVTRKFSDKGKSNKFKKNVDENSILK